MLRFILALAIVLSPVAAFCADSYQKAFDLTDKSQYYAALQLAEAKKDKSLVDYIHWRRLKKIDERPKAEFIIRFLREHSHWPDAEILLKRAIESWALEGANVRLADQVFSVIRQLSAKPYNAAKSKDTLLQTIWERGEFTGIEQEHLLQRFKQFRARAQIEKRVDYLLWHERVGAAERLIPKLDSGLQKLQKARIALMQKKHNVNSLINAVPAKYKKEPSLIYERMRWRHKKGLDAGVRELLLQAPKTVPHPEKWWHYRAIHVRNAIEKRRYSEALKLLRNHGQVDGAPLADALWLRGWVQLSFTNKPSEAYKDFFQLHKHVSYPVSVARGAYWAGRAAQKNGNQQIANNWYDQAKQYPTTFYGQLAVIERHKQAPIPFSFDDRSANPSALPSEVRATIPLIKLLAQYDQNYSVEKFLYHFATQHTKPEQFISLANIAREIGYPHMGVRIGKVATQNHQLELVSISHPKVNVKGLPIEPALVHAIARQESEFNPKARSRADARGLMQLLPSTAKHVARRNDIPYNAVKLYQADYNMKLGSHYLASLIERYDGRYPLAIAAYNAGPGNVSKWIKQYGEPPRDTAGLLDWLERIPFSETRNYVQRVLENLHVYRHLLGDRSILSTQKMFGKG